MNEPLNFKLTALEYNIIHHALQKAPLALEQSLPLLQNLEAQVKAQVAPPEPAPAVETAPKAEAEAGLAEGEW